MQLNLTKSILVEAGQGRNNEQAQWVKTQKKWDNRFLQLAKNIASWSKDPSTKVGAVAVDYYNKIVGTGYNGFPHHVEDDDRLYDRETKYKIILHAECNCIINMKGGEGIEIYTYPLPPCSRCASMIIQSGFRNVISMSEWPERWNEDIQLSLELFKEAGLEVRLYDNYNIVVL